MAVGAGSAVGMRLSAVRGGMTEVTVSGGSARGVVLDGALGVAERLGGAVVCGVVDITERGMGGPTVALVVALSPLLMITAVATAPIATTAPTNTATGRQRRSTGQPHSSSAAFQLSVLGSASYSSSLS